MTRPVLLVLLALAVPAAEARYTSQRGVGRKVRALARLPHVTATTIGRSRGRRPIHLLTIAHPGPRKADDRPALLIVGGLHGEHRLGVELALAAATRLASADPKTLKALAHRTIHVVPLANPDGLAHFVGRGVTGNACGVDLDRDGARGEDGPRDLDGDGVIRWMRVPDSTGEWVRDVEDRLMRKADRVKGERGAYRLLREGGLDDDGDGAIDEDPPHGVAVHRNFPHRFARHTPEHGAYATSEPAAHALVKLVVDRPQIGLVLTYGLDDNVAANPHKAKKLEHHKPLTELHPGDHPLYVRVAERYRELTKVNAGLRGVPSGAFHEWAYYHRGLLSVAVRGWHTPTDMPAPEEAGSGSGSGSGKPAPPKSRHPEMAWLALADRLGRGFAAWKSFDHPTLGAVEIGGFDPGFTVNPPASELPRITAREAPFVDHLLGLLPDPELTLTTKALPGGLLRIEAAVSNEGWLPTALVQGDRSKAVRPLVLELLGEATLLGARPEGRRVHVLRPLAGKGGRAEVSWLVRPKPGARLKVQLRSGRGWDVTRDVEISR